MRFTFLCINIIFYISMVLLWQEVQLAFYLFELNQYFQLLQLYFFIYFFKTQVSVPLLKWRVFVILLPPMIRKCVRRWDHQASVYAVYDTALFICVCVRVSPPWCQLSIIHGYIYLPHCGACSNPASFQIPTRCLFWGLHPKETGHSLKL